MAKAFEGAGSGFLKMGLSELGNAVVSPQANVPDKGMGLYGTGVQGQNAGEPGGPSVQFASLTLNDLRQEPERDAKTREPSKERQRDGLER
jgi:hypothetical protein